MILLKGKHIVQKLSSDIKNRLHLENHPIKPKLVSLCLTKDQSSQKYNQAIEKMAHSLGFIYESRKYPKADISLAKSLVRKLNEDPNIHGILINQPLPKGFLCLLDTINPNKDIEGVSSTSLGKLFLQQKTHVPCTPQAVMTLIDAYNIQLLGKKVCILGNSLIIGKPLTLLLTDRKATVTLCHSETKNIKKETQRAGIIITAVGKPHYINKDWLEKGAIMIDVGTSYKNNQVLGDIDFESVKNKVAQITPVPGGIGIITTTMLLKNCLNAYFHQIGS